MRTNTGESGKLRPNKRETELKSGLRTELREDETETTSDEYKTKATTETNHKKADTDGE